MMLTILVTSRRMLPFTLTHPDLITIVIARHATPGTLCGTPRYARLLLDLGTRDKPKQLSKISIIFSSTSRH